MASPSKFRALIIDDQVGIAALIDQALARRGWECQVLDDPTKLEAALASEFDLVICDLRMPERDGLDVLQHLRQNAPHLAERFVLMTGNPTELSGREAETAGIGVLLKPFSLSQLLSAVQQLVQAD